MKIKKGDNVIILTGDDKGKKGQVVKALPSLNKVVVEGINMVKKAHKARKTGEPSQMIDVAMPISVSNVKKVN